MTGASGIHGIIGGLHLLDADDGRIEKTAAALDGLSPDWVFAGHCTGFRAQAAFCHRFQSRFAPMFSGMECVVEAA